MHAYVCGCVGVYSALQCTPVDLGQEEGPNRDQWQEQAVSVGNKREIPWIWGKKRGAHRDKWQAQAVSGGNNGICREQTVPVGPVCFFIFFPSIFCQALFFNSCGVPINPCPMSMFTSRVWSIRLLVSGASDPAPYSCHPYPHTPHPIPVPSPCTPYSCHPVCVCVCVCVSRGMQVCTYVRISACKYRLKILPRVRV